MIDELQAAAERLRFMEYDSLSGFTPLNTQYMKDLEMIRAIYLAEHPADDGDAVTLDWLRHIGFELFSTCEQETFYALGKLEFHPKHSCKWQYGTKKAALPVPVTRGGVRLLCRALGIALKETTNG